MEDLLNEIKSFRKADGKQRANMMLRLKKFQKL